MDLLHQRQSENSEHETSIKRCSPHSSKENEGIHPMILWETSFSANDEEPHLENLHIDSSYR